MLKKGVELGWGRGMLVLYIYGGKLTVSHITPGKIVRLLFAIHHKYIKELVFLRFLKLNLEYHNI